MSKLHTIQIYKHKERTTRGKSPSPSQAILTSEEISARHARKGNGLEGNAHNGLQRQPFAFRLLHSVILCFSRRWDQNWTQKGVRKPFEQRSHNERPRKTYIPKTVCRFYTYRKRICEITVQAGSPTGQPTSRPYCNRLFCKSSVLFNRVLL